MKISNKYPFGNISGEKELREITYSSFVGTVRAKLMKGCVDELEASTYGNSRLCSKNGH